MYDVYKLIQCIGPHIRAAMEDAYGYQNTWRIPSNPFMYDPMYYNSPYNVENFFRQLNIGMCNHHNMDGTSAAVIEGNTATCSLCGKTWHCISKESECYIRLVWNIVNDCALCKQPELNIGNRMSAGNAYMTVLNHTNENVSQTLKMLVHARMKESYEDDYILIQSIDDEFIITLKKINKEEE